MALVLLVACQAEQRRQLLPMLRSAGHLVVVAERVESGVRIAVEQRPDLAVLVVDAPGPEGLRGVQALQSKSPEVPVVVVTPHTGDGDRILAYEAGARDVVPYPVSERELGLRVDTVAGRREVAPAPLSSLEFGELRVDTDARRAFVGADEKALTALEFDLLVVILRSRGRVLTRRQLLVQVWQGRISGETRTVDTHVKRLRKKLGRAASYVQTVRGVGYRLAGTVGNGPSSAARGSMASVARRRARANAELPT